MTSDGDDRAAAKREAFRQAARRWAIYAGWAVLALALFWFLVNQPPAVSGFLRALFRLLSLLG